MLSPSTCSNCWHKVTSAQLHDDPFTSVQGDGWYCDANDLKVINKEIGTKSRHLWCSLYPVDEDYYSKISEGKVYDENF